MFTFIELPPFAAMREYIFKDDDEFLEFQLHMCKHPNSGAVIPRTGGCRKIRWTRPGMGKRGGSRIIYFLRISEREVVLMTAYAKNECEDVPREWLKQIKEVFDGESS